MSHPDVANYRTTDDLPWNYRPVRSARPEFLHCAHGCRVSVAGAPDGDIEIVHVRRGVHRVTVTR